MSLAKLRKEDLEKELSKVKSATADIAKEVESIEKKMEEHTDQLRSWQKAISSNQALQSKLEKKLILIKDYSKDFVNAYNEVLANWKRLESKDITIRKRDELQAKDIELLAKRNELCDHRLLVGFKGYRGSHAYDHDDGYAGGRNCLLCGLHVMELVGSYGKLHLNGERLLFLTGNDNRNNGFNYIVREMRSAKIEAIGEFFLEAIENQYWSVHRAEPPKDQ